MEKQLYCPDKSFRGFECNYWIDHDTLYVESYGANSFRDWMDCIFGSLLKSRKCFGIKYQRKWFYQAFRFFREITHIQKLDFTYIRFQGLSMGGAVNECLDVLFSSLGYSIIVNNTFGSPKACSDSDHDPITRFRNAGDFIPFLPPWYKKGNRIILNKKWRPVWKSHADYDWRF